jgi:branched-subunit amino acid ABC-type transport system permease component
MDFLFNLTPHLINGITLGLLFALIALGFMLIVGVMEVINLAHGSLFALGAYVAMTIIGIEPDWFGPLGEWYVGLSDGARYSFALVLAPILVGLVGMVLELCLRGTYGKDPLFGLLLTFGAAMVIEELIRIGWGSGEQFLQTPPAISGAFIWNGLIW